jgi:hypothetical protein
MHSRRSQKVIILGAIVLIVLFAISRYYLVHQAETGREPALMGDVICGSLVSSDAQDACCLNTHREEVTVQCLGKWSYISGVHQCQFLCDSALPQCGTERKECPGGSSVSRNRSNECAFDAC